MDDLKPMRHGYTNATLGGDDVIVKRYRGPDADLRRGERSGLMTALVGRLPVPSVASDVEADRLMTVRVPGVPGQELLDRGLHTARRVMASCGRLLRRLQGIDPTELPPAVAEALTTRGTLDTAGRTHVLVHGDFGPNNLLLDERTLEPTALVDWEFATIGGRIRDLVWCEWIVRTHHPERVVALDAFFDAYGRQHAPGWETRQQAMLTRCAELREFCMRWDDGGAGTATWDAFIARTAAWNPQIL